jgi:hypothetical protein
MIGYGVLAGQVNSRSTKRRFPNAPVQPFLKNWALQLIDEQEIVLFNLRSS